MALTSVFYDGVVTESARAKNRTGSPDYGVYGMDDFKVVPHPSIPFAVLVTKGRAHGWGVTDEAIEDQVVHCDSNSSGSRWDVIAVRRNWQPLLGGPSELVVLKGGATAGIPSTRKVGPGVEDDQPIALVEWKGTLSAPNQIIDLRTWAHNGGLLAKSKHVLEYLEHLGTTVQIGNILSTFEFMANGTADWVDRDITQAGADVTAFGPGFEPVTGNAHKPRVRRNGNSVQLIGAVRRLTGEFSNMLTVPAAFRPVSGATLFIGAGTSSNGIAYELAMTNGVVAIVNGYATESDTGAFSIFPITASWSIV